MEAIGHMWPLEPGTDAPLPNRQGVGPDEKRKLWHIPSRSLTLSQSCLMA